jgi:hypothetical protein
MTSFPIRTDDLVPQRLLITSRAELHEAVRVALLAGTRTVRAMHRDLSVYDLSSRACTDALRQLLLADRGARVHLLVDDPGWLDTRAARLRLLQRRFPHALELRIASSEDSVGDDAWLLADDRAALEVRATPSANGSLWLSHRPHSQPLIASFERRWAAAGHNLPVVPLGLG